ncbi:MAG: helix-turn-helix domain-containing protein [Chloroflexaceae bacterium]|nr:helix-turn-helix domain-containing protein [Chloroflexaceae bacterium]
MGRIADLSYQERERIVEWHLSGISQTEIAKRVGASQKTISNWLRDVKRETFQASLVYQDFLENELFTLAKMEQEAYALWKSTDDTRYFAAAMQAKALRLRLVDDAGMLQRTAQEAPRAVVILPDNGRLLPEIAEQDQE